jgi:hypothetical protein
MPYWVARLDGRDHDEVHFRNGYMTKSPFIAEPPAFIGKLA